MNADELLRRLTDQEWECCCCGGEIQRGDQLAIAFDNRGIAHRDCAAPPEFRAPERFG